MDAGNLNTTNMLLGILAAASVLQVLMLIGAAYMGYRLYRQAMQTVSDIEQRQIAPLTARVDSIMAIVHAILGDVKDISARVTSRTERVDSAIDHTIQRVDDTAERVRTSIGTSISRIAGLAHGAKCALEGLFNGRRAA